MTATALKNDKIESALDEIRDRLDKLPDLSDLNLPKLEVVGKKADDAIDKVRGRNQRNVWPWVVAGLAVVGVAGIVTTMVYSMWSRNRTEPWPDEATESLDRMSETGLDSGYGSSDVAGERITTGLTAAEGSLVSYDPVEGRGA